MEKAEIGSLVLKVQLGDNNSFDELYRLTNQRAYFVALKIARNETDALDILQFSYVKAFERISQINNPESFIP